MSERLIRAVQNSKGNSVNSGSNKGAMSHAPSKANMAEGEEVYSLLSNGFLYLYKKVNGLLWRTALSYNGNQNVDKKLTTRELEYKYSFVDYRFFNHNFNKNGGLQTKTYLPWGDITDGTAMTSSATGIVAPFKMTLHKILMRIEGITSSDDVTITVEKSDDGNQTEDVVATATYDVSSVGAISANTTFELNTTDFDNTPSVDAGLLCGIGIETPSNLGGSYNDYWMTSVWRVEVKL